MATPVPHLEAEFDVDIRQVLVTKDKVFACASRNTGLGIENNSIRCFDIKSWKTKWVCDVRFDPVYLAISNGVVYAETYGIATGKGFLYAIRESTGATLWTTPLKNPANRFSPIPADDVIFTVCHEALWAIRADTGKLKWKFKIETATPTVIHDETHHLAVFGTDHGDVIAADIRTGEERWRTKVGDRIVLALARDGDVLVVGSHREPLHFLKCSDGKPVSKPRHSVYSPMTVVEHAAFFACNAKETTVAKIDVDTKKLCWKFRVEKRDDWVSRWSQWLIHNGTLYFLSSDGDLYSIDAGTGLLLWCLPNVGGQALGYAPFRIHAGRLLIFTGSAVQSISV